MRAEAQLDEIDRRILELLIEDGRRTVADIAKRVQLSPAPATRRIERLERSGVIVGYTALVDQSRFGGGFEAFTELRYAGETSVSAIKDAMIGIPEVLEVFTIAGDPDSIVRIRVDGVAHLQRVVDQMRRSGRVIGTKTMIVLSTWRRNDLLALERRTSADQESGSERG